MKRFDCLSLDCALFGPHLLEASAGTGKTFSIEHIFVRLVLEGLDLESILVVTFTKAATRELKARIRENLEKALLFLEDEIAGFEYLKKYLHSTVYKNRLKDALSIFDRSQIFTIHGFCFRMLKQFSFEANIRFSLQDPDEKNQVSDRLKIALDDFLEYGLDENILCLEQIAFLFKEFSNLEELKEQLLQFEDLKGPFFSEILEKCKAALHTWHGAEIQGDLLLDDFLSLKANYKAKKADLESQVKALASIMNGNVDAIRILVKESGTIFDFFKDTNKKVKQVPVELHYPGFFLWAENVFLDHVKKNKIFSTLQLAWNEVAKKILEEEARMDPDAILLEMKNALQSEKFVDCIKSKYTSAIIDEFQDTDAMQWEIFEKLFLYDLQALYLVGDPKQSIYRFRNADIYTYLKAKNALHKEHHYILDTNFRSSKKLISALNVLFHRDWLKLPKTNASLPYIPVHAGSKIEKSFQDQKGAIHFVLSYGDPSQLFDDAFLPYVVQEIEKLELKNCAILVKDRYQAQKAIDLLKSRGLKAVARQHLSLHETYAFKTFKELLLAILDPYDLSKQQIVKKGPFAKRDILDDRMKLELGLVTFAKSIYSDLDAQQVEVLEWILQKSYLEGFSFSWLENVLNIKEHIPCRAEVDESAVQVMTMHISKGLEFDVVFALGVVARTSKQEREIEEFSAEKLRQLYVAFTRAKTRLYIPFAKTEKEPDFGENSPIELFLQHYPDLLESLDSLSQNESISYEEISSSIHLLPKDMKPIEIEMQKSIEIPSIMPCYINSFSTLANPKIIHSFPQSNEHNPLTLPKGAEVGVLFHKIFEEIFSSQNKAWSQKDLTENIIEKNVKISSFSQHIDEIKNMVINILEMPFEISHDKFFLKDLEKVQTEVEFLYKDGKDYIKGFIDLVFSINGKVYFLDWKTNWLEQYTQDQMKKVVFENDYSLQYQIYRLALERHFKTPIEGAFFVFVRGGTFLWMN
jgi:exodeoxyribonuclease V beta subunit